MRDYIVVYKSVYGSTRRYAEWIKDELNADIIDLDDLKYDVLKDYRNVIFGVPVHAFRRYHIRAIRKLLDHQKSIRVYLYFVSLGLIDQHDLHLDLRRRLRDDQLRRVNIYVFPGAINYARLSLRHRAALAVVFRHLNRIVPSKRSEDTRKFLDSYGKFSDFTDQSAIKSLIDDCRK